MKCWEDYEEVIEEASRRFRQFRRGVRGQAITPHDSFDYWVYQVTREKYDSQYP